MADAFKACAVCDCNNNAHYSASGARGLCAMHYVRQKRHGSPTAGRAFAGEAERWLEDRVGHNDGSDCLKWPFGTASSGYGYLRAGGVLLGAHRTMCALVNGPPPTPKHEAAHSCGKGHEGCVNPRHLRWATSQENKADIILHRAAAAGCR